jgi:hypothetical protein
MEKRKTEKANLENKRTLFLEIGFVVALAVVFFSYGVEKLRQARI